jgi:hypothetical protein
MGARSGWLMRSSACRLIDPSAASEAMSELVIPPELTLALQQAEQHWLTLDLRWEIEQERRDALELKALRAEPAEKLAEPGLVSLRLGEAAEPRSFAGGERGLNLNQAGPHLDQFIDARQHIWKERASLCERERPVHARKPA